jgi:Flp pilus assembly protein TadG
MEFAIALPLLVVLVVGIFDFGGALNLKHELYNAVRDGARFGSNLPATDITAGGTPQSVIAIRDLVKAYLDRALINDCGISGAGRSGSTFTWTATGACTVSTTLTLTIDRAYVIQLTPTPTNGKDLICTRVTISYPYQWHFGNVIQLLVPGATYGSSIQITAESIMPNLM